MDAPKVTRVLLNVISNAIEAMSDDGTLSISSRFSTRKKGRFILFSVADTGCGIPECDLEQIQQPFITTKEHGTGLGLSICRKLIEACGGKLLIRSEVGKGTTVKILLPVKSPPESG
jgi:two-component system sporulation sensor kinase A